MRQSSLAEIQKAWEERKGDLTRDYKKKHKFALRRANKLQIAAVSDDF
jgi:hypothetical protein